MGIWYTSLEAVKTALDIQLTARNNAQVRRAIDSGSRAAEGLLSRRFYPWTGTRTISPLPTREPWQLALGRHELISASSIVSEGTTITAYTLVPAPGVAESDAGPPYNRIDLDQSVLGAWPGDADIAGVWGYRADEEQIGTLAAQLGNTSSSTATVTWNTASIGTGNILRIDNERVIIRDRTWVDSGQDLGGSGLSASMSDNAVPVTNGSAYAVDEVLQLDSERMLITSIASNTATVVRAWDGSVLASHTAGTSIYALTGVELDRAQLGTTIATHSSSAAIYRQQIPGLVGDLALAETLNRLQQELGGYGRTEGSGESAVVVALGGLDTIRRDAKAAYGRRRTWLGV